MFHEMFLEREKFRTMGKILAHVEKKIAWSELKLSMQRRTVCQASDCCSSFYSYTTIVADSWYGLEIVEH